MIVMSSKWRKLIQVLRKEFAEHRSLLGLDDCTYADYHTYHAKYHMYLCQTYGIESVGWGTFHFIDHRSEFLFKLKFSEYL